MYNHLKTNLGLLDFVIQLLQLELPLLGLGLHPLGIRYGQGHAVGHVGEVAVPSPAIGEELLI